MKGKTKNVVKIITYFLPFVWLILKNYFPTVMQFKNLNYQGIFLVFMIFSLTASLITFPSVDSIRNLFSDGSDNNVGKSLKTVFLIFMILYVGMMVWSFICFRPFLEPFGGIMQVLFLLTLTWYLWFSFGMAFIRYCDAMDIEKEKLIQEE